MYGYAGGAVVAASLPQTQTIVPDTTVAAGGWVDQVGGSSDLHSPLADTDPNTYIQSPANPVAATVKLGLGPINTPAAGDIILTLDVEQV